MPNPLPRVVIIGGGFAGLNAALSLAEAPLRVTLIDRRNHHLFQPLLYQVATAGLSPSDIASPIRRILRNQQNADVLLADAKSIDLPAKSVQLDNGAIPYDYLIVATGARHSYFGHDEWEKVAPGLKSIGDALEIRKRILSAFEMAERESDPEARTAWLTFVIIGAGPTGVELAGALCEIAHHALAADFRHIDPKEAQIILLEGEDRVLPPYPRDLSEKARQQLVRLGVAVRLGERVTQIDEQGVNVGELRIPARTVLWAAGVQGSRLGRELGAPHDKAGRVLVEPDLSVTGNPQVFVVGDIASLKIDGKLVPGVAPAAIQEGKHAAANVLRLVAGKPTEKFVYVDKGSLATIGRSAAVADLGKIKLSGAIAWLAWLFIHLIFLIGFRNRLLVLIQWAWSFVSYDRGARLITGPLRPNPPPVRGGSPNDETRIPESNPNDE